MKYLVTGCAGFIGSNLVERLLALGHEVVGVDNFSTGNASFLAHFFTNPRFKLYANDIVSQKDVLISAMQDTDFVFHLAAKADIKNDFDNPSLDLEKNIVATFNVLEAMRETGVKKIAFTSTGSVYGNPNFVASKETDFLYPQTSIYSASKLAGEALIQAYCEGYGMTGYIFRLVSVLGKNYHHGHVIDFYNQLIYHPYYLNVLGDGNQQKSYISVDDCISGMFCGILNGKQKVNIFNVGTDEELRIKESARLIANIVRNFKDVEINYEKEKTQGWIGDNPYILLDCSKLRGYGWRPAFTIEQSIKMTLAYLMEKE